LLSLFGFVGFGLAQRHPLGEFTRGNAVEQFLDGVAEAFG
jgi:hypothetical protein